MDRWLQETQHLSGNPAGHARSVVNVAEGWESGPWPTAATMAPINCKWMEHEYLVPHLLRVLWLYCGCSSGHLHNSLWAVQLLPAASWFWKACHLGKAPPDTVATHILRGGKFH